MGYMLTGYDDVEILRVHRRGNGGLTLDKSRTLHVRETGGNNVKTEVGLAVSVVAVRFSGESRGQGEEELSTRRPLG
ncbi:Hypothetical protein CINCED_3A022535 [Cinara cedri]|uniref:Uncharacterized protein n=1 Tax=Cinara cedri TaxID=506608 RepID=A0A5E4MA36_9HEMI|nr:Hypothetical protein CINCED_3A022535 [Cinara cedri]